MVSSRQPPAGYEFVPVPNVSGDPPRRVHVTPRPYGRPPVDRYTMRPETEQKRNRIRDVAAMLFAEQGLSGMSMTAIARVVHLAPRSMAYFYTRREELLADIVDEHLRTVLQAICAAHDAAATAEPAVRLERMLMEYLHEVRRDPHAHHVFVHALSALTERDRNAVMPRWSVIVQTLAGSLAEAVSWLSERGAEFLVATVLLGAGVALCRFDPEQVVELGEHARRLAAMLLAGAQEE